MQQLTLLISSVLAASVVVAQPTGDWGRQMMYGSPFGGVLSALFFVGLTLFVWLWVIKLWRELFRKKK